MRPPVLPLLLLVAGLVLAGCSSAPSAPASDTGSPSDTGTPSATPSGTATPSSAPTSHAPQSYSVDIVDYSFSPKSINVTVGDTVTWTNQGQKTHTVTAYSSVGGVVDSGALGPGMTFSHTFTQPGLWAYHCKIHGNMSATVNVQ